MLANSNSRPKKKCCAKYDNNNPNTVYIGNNDLHSNVTVTRAPSVGHVSELDLELDDRIAKSVAQTMKLAVVGSIPMMGQLYSSIILNQNTPNT